MFCPNTFKLGQFNASLAFFAIFPCLAHSQSSVQFGIASGLLRQDYREFAASAPNGILDRETGLLNTWQIQADYLPILSVSKLHIPLYLQGLYRQSGGDTQYDGYLQQGQMLTPYASKTYNHLQDMQLSVGLRFSQQAVQLTPLVSYAHHAWQRDLSQYQETYHHQAIAVGVLASWAINPQWQIISQLSVGQMQSAWLDVPQLSFSASLGTQTLKTAQVQLAYCLNPQWQFALSADYQHYGYGQSALNNGLFAPESTTKQRGFLASLNYAY